MRKKIKESVINKIEKGEVRQRPRYLYILAGILSSAGLIVSAAISMFALNLLWFRFSHPGPGASMKISYLLSSVSWYCPTLAVMALLTGVILLRRFDFSYRRNAYLIFGLFFLGIILGSFAMDRLGVSEFLTRRGYFRDYRQDINFRRGPGRGMRFQER